MEQLTRIPPPGWPKAVIINELTYRISHSKRRWRQEHGYYGQNRGVYYCRDSARRFARYLYLPYKEAQDAIAPKALPKWLRVSEGL